jgi:flavin reductase (DIM6/NTAB) family NADH-FMN oxidoreductase RutF
MSSNALPKTAGLLDRRQFCRTCSRFATGITVATVRGPDGEPHGMTANSFTSVSLTPPLVLICVDHRAKIIEHFRRCDFFGINVLHHNQKSLSIHFARSGYDRFDGIEWYAGSTGIPLLPEVLATIECAVHRRVEAGDHMILIGEVLHAECRDGEPLVYYGSEYHSLQT